MIRNYHFGKSFFFGCLGVSQNSSRLSFVFDGEFREGGYQVQDAHRDRDEARDEGGDIGRVAHLVKFRHCKAPDHKNRKHL